MKVHFSLAWVLRDLDCMSFQSLDHLQSSRKDGLCLSLAKSCAVHLNHMRQWPRLSRHVHRCGKRDREVAWPGQTTRVCDEQQRIFSSRPRWKDLHLGGIRTEAGRAISCRALCSTVPQTPVKVSGKMLRDRKRRYDYCFSLSGGGGGGPHFLLCCFLKRQKYGLVFAIHSINLNFFRACQRAVRHWNRKHWIRTRH